MTTTIGKDNPFRYRGYYYEDGNRAVLPEPARRSIRLNRMKFTVFKKGIISIYFVFAVVSLLIIFNSVALGNNLLIQIIGVVIGLFCTVVLVNLLIFDQLSHKLLIDKEGVKYIKRKKEYSLKWGEINYIGFSSNYYGRIGNYSMIYFNAGGFEQAQKIKSTKQYNENFFGIQYREKVMDEILKYWDKPIQGIYQVEGKDRK